MDKPELKAEETGSCESCDGEGVVGCKTCGGCGTLPNFAGTTKKCPKCPDGSVPCPECSCPHCDGYAKETNALRAALKAAEEIIDIHGEEYIKKNHTEFELRERVMGLQGEVEELSGVIFEALDICVNTEELNMSNYDRQLVEQLNNGMIEVHNKLAIPVVGAPEGE